MDYNQIEKLQDFDNYIENINLPKNSDRKNVLQEGDIRYRGVAIGYVRSRGFGHKLLLSRYLGFRKFQELFQKTVEIFRMFNKDFEFTTIQYNQNYVCRKHIDTRNVGESYIIGVGDYEGGELLVFWNGKDNPPEKIDINHKYFKFNGSQYYHETVPFTGNRWTMIFFNLQQDKDNIDLSILK